MKQAADHLPPSGPSGLIVPDQTAKHCHLLDWAHLVLLSASAPSIVEAGKSRPTSLAASATVGAPHAAAKHQRTPTYLRLAVYETLGDICSLQMANMASTACQQQEVCRAD